MKSMKEIIHSIFHKKHEILTFVSLDDSKSNHKFWESTQRVSCSKCSHTYTWGNSYMKEEFFGEYGETKEEATNMARRAISIC